MKKEKDFYQISPKVIMKNGKGEILLLNAGVRQASFRIFEYNK